MKYELHRALRKLVIKITGRKCSSCNHYDGRFGQDCCFECERSIKVVNYDRR
ncbi:MAG: hypothetical protein ACRC3H_13235 [Lachnospiraceae bacterium]